MLLLTEGIPAIPDLTHPQDLLQFGQQLLHLSQWLILLLAGLGVVLAAVNFSYRGGRLRRDEAERWDWLDAELARYGQLLRGAGQGLMILVILIGGFFLCSTLANRYHHWEQDKIAQVANSVAGERVEQLAPQVHYTLEEPYTTITYIDGKPTEVERLRQVDRLLSPRTSQAEVKLTQVTDPATLRLIYASEFSGRYQVANTLAIPQNFTFEVTPPCGVYPVARLSSGTAGAAFGTPESRHLSLPPPTLAWGINGVSCHLQSSRSTALGL
ncbi:hypothetical protein [Neosynechococcus sphagnicola]|uniref:hypothetical protein n=1 Tax=Neosynechococcus sphagnicola TaxID=1501145 RepID=UPI000A9925AF|nr:hypothetical protein [Neosynechococcus sphagnicola]